MNNAVIQSLVRCAASEELETLHSLSLPSLYANAIKTNFGRKCVLIFFFKKSQRNPPARSVGRKRRKMKARWLFSLL